MFIPEFEKKNQVQNYYSNLRLVISGSIFEFYRFNHAITYGKKFKRKNKIETEEMLKTTNPMTEKEKLLASARRAKRTISRLIRSNVFSWPDKNNKPYLPIVLTLTFKDEIRDIKTANSLFTDFIQRLNYSVNLNERKIDRKEAKKNLLKYSAVIEFQDKNRGGVIHYHMIFYNLPRMERIYDRLTDIWGKGYFWVGAKDKNNEPSHIYDSKKINKIVDYFTKYIVKSFGDSRLKNKKKHFNSKGLCQPTESEMEELIHIIDKEIPKETLSYSADQLSYRQGFHEKYFNYRVYDLSNYPEFIEKSKKLLFQYS